MDESTKKVKLVPVHQVMRTGTIAVVEWTVKGERKRGILPADKVTSEKLDAELLDAALPYGVPWSEMPIRPFTGADFEKALHDAEIWTAEQAMANAQKVVGALQAMYRVHLGSLVEFAAKYKM